MNSFFHKDKSIKKSNSHPDEDLAEVDDRIREMMGPAPELDGSLPKRKEQLLQPPAPEPTEVKAPEVQSPSPAKAPPTGVPPVPEAAPVANSGLKDREIHVEQDLDLSAPPEDMNTTGVDEDTPMSHSELSDSIAKSLVPDGKTEATEEEPVKNTPMAKPTVMRSSIFEKIKYRFYAWWDNRVARYVTFAIILALIAVVAFVPVVRNTVLNTVGVRASVEVRAIDQSTLQPLENVTISVGDLEAKTGEDGKAKLEQVPLGEQVVSVEKPGFAPFKKTIVFGMRAEDLGEIDMKVVGLQYKFKLVDYLSNKPVTGVQLSSGEATTKSDKDGLALLTVQPGASSIEVVIDGKNYRKEKVELAADVTAEQQVKLVPGQKYVYVNKSSGKYDVYKMDLDGTNKDVLLAGSGIETNNINLSVNPTGTRAALVSTRDEKRNADGYLMSALTLIDVASGESETVEHSEYVDILGWNDDAVIYRFTTAGASAASPTREKIMAYDYKSSKRIQLATANYFNGMSLADDTVYYVISSTDPNMEAGFAKVKTDGSSRKMLYTGTIWGLFRTSQTSIKLSAPNQWFDYKIGEPAAKKGQPIDDMSTYSAVRTFIKNRPGTKSTWVDARDSSGVIMIRDLEKEEDKALYNARGIREVTRWISDNAIIYRQLLNGATTEYAISIDGGDPVELAEVTAHYRL